MIRGIHGLLYSSDAEATRRFFREVVRLPGTDVGEGWWIFDFQEGDLGVHPVEELGEAGKHDVSFYCFPALDGKVDMSRMLLLEDSRGYRWAEDLFLHLWSQAREPL